MHNVVKWPNILEKSCGVNTARFLRYVWLFYNIMHERVKTYIMKTSLILRGHPLSTYIKFSEKLTFLTPWYAHVRCAYQEVKSVSFSENFAYVLNGWPLSRVFLTHYFMKTSPVYCLLPFDQWQMNVQVEQG